MNRSTGGIFWPPTQVMLPLFEVRAATTPTRQPVSCSLKRRPWAFGIGGANTQSPHPAVDAELRLGVLEALIGQRVEAAVVEAADVGHEAHPDPLASSTGGLARAGGACAAFALVAPATACGRDGEHQRGEECQDTRQLSLQVH